MDRHTPRNLSIVAKNVGVHIETVRQRIQRMSSPFFELVMFANIYHTNLGMKKAVIFVETDPKYEELALECLKVNDYFIYLSRCFGEFEGYLGIYVIPAEHCSKFEDFVHELQRLGIAKKTTIVWSTCFQRARFSHEWFDSNIERWSFEWEKWIEQISSSETAILPYTLQDPVAFPQLADEIDVLILKELEKNARFSMNDIAKTLKVPASAIRYHYLNHIIPRRLLEGFQLHLHPFGTPLSEMAFFKFDFHSQEHMAKFAMSLLHKPFTKVLGKVLDENSLLCQMTLPRQEFTRFIHSLSILIRKGLLRSYFYVLQEIEKSFRETIPYQFFKESSWIYDHNRDIEKLHKLAKKSIVEREHLQRVKEKKF